MGKESIFQSALSNFIFEFTCGGAIRHLADQGLTAKQIAERLSFPLPYGRVRQAVTDYFLDRGILLRREPARGGKEQRYTYVRDYGEYGRVSFRRVPAESGAEESENGGNKEWEEQAISCGELAALLRKRRVQPGQAKDYAACDFGLTGTEFEGFEALNERQQEYLQGICWDRRTMYHLLNQGMTEIVIKLCECNFWRGKIYLGNTRTIFVLNQTIVEKESRETQNGFI